MFNNNSSSNSDKSPAYPKNDEERHQLQILKTRITARWESELLTDEIFLLKFLRFCNNNVDATFNRITLHNPVVKDLKPPSYFKTFLKSKILVPLEHCDQFGRQVFLFRIGEWDPSSLSMVDMMTQCYYVEDITADRQCTQLNGIVMIFDMKGFRFEHLATFTKTAAAQMFVGSSEGMPVKVKGVHVINNGSTSSLFYRLIRPLLKVKLRSRIFVHGEELSTLDEKVPPSILPMEYGGTLENDEAEEKNYIEEILGREDYYRDFFKVLLAMH